MLKTKQLDNLLRYFTPSQQLPLLTWARHHARNVDGRPYSHQAYPHLGAPGGPADALDCPFVRKVWLQFASRLGKTFMGQCKLLQKADATPGPMLFASSSEKVAYEVVERTYKMIEQSPRVAVQLRAKGRRRQKCIDFDACQCFVAWARSVSTLADKEAEFGHGNEIDKWEHASTSREADPLKLFLDRFKNRPHHKVLLESTPTVKGKSRIESGVLQGTNCEYYVPCPKCLKFQVIKMDAISWDKDPNGRSDRARARASAFYTCQHCNEALHDSDRYAMMRRGVWVPEGSRVKHEEALAAADRWTEDTSRGIWQGWNTADWIEGAPLRNGADASYRLSSLYAISLTWGDIAAEFVGCNHRPQDLRNFINSWLAETWDIVRRETTWEQLGKAIIDREMMRGLIPPWASVVTMGIDRQSENGDRFPWVIDAWGADGRCHTVAYGEAFSFQELHEILKVDYHYSDGSGKTKINFALFDSGYKPDGVYEFCVQCLKKGINAWPSKGSNTALESDYRQQRLSANTSMPGMMLTYVDTIRSQLWIEAQIKSPDGKYTLHSGTMSDHQDFLEQLLNDAAIDNLDSSNNMRTRWERVNESYPNDFRDCRRYGRTAAIAFSRGRPIVDRIPKPAAGAESTATQPKQVPGKARNPLHRQGGWLNMP